MYCRKGRNKNYKLLYISDIKFKKNIKSKTIIFFKNYKEILKQNIDVVFITLPTYLAARVTLTFIKKGVHVFCEKPPARNVNEIKKVIQTSKKFPHIKIKYGFNHRYHSSVKLAKKIIKSKKYGKIRYVIANFRYPSLTRNNNRYKKDEGDGFFYDAASYLISRESFLFRNKNSIILKSYSQKIKNAVDLRGNIYINSSEGNRFYF